MSTNEWLRALGAFRPMAVASEECLVLGTWANGYYPIEWRAYFDHINRDINGKRMNPGRIEDWALFGFRLAPGTQLTQGDCERILAQLVSAQKSESK